jgi:hypothetical protein
MFVSVHRMDGIIKCTRTCALLRTAHHTKPASKKSHDLSLSDLQNLHNTHGSMGGRGGSTNIMHIIPLFAINFKRFKLVANKSLCGAF